MEMPLMNMQGQQVGMLQVSELLFARPFNEPLVHQVIVACQANLRQGTRKQKGRSEIAKSTRKPWRQKGTGNARAGMASSPLWRGGGKIFPNLTTENFTHKINRKMYRGAMGSLLTRRVEEKNLVVVDDLQVDSHKTRDLVPILKGLSMEQALVVVDGVSNKLAQASANLPFVTILEPMQINPLLLMDHPRLLLTKKALEKMEQVWAKS